MASEGETDQAMPTAGFSTRGCANAYADTVRAHIATVQRIREKFVVGGLDFALLPFGRNNVISKKPVSIGVSKPKMLAEKCSVYIRI